ncbi:M3 family oligoendopeptidase [Alkalihalobacterium bogoriense]|uniref:M3 family oligoendopeptidase n=1 Tax=Alkalihalobacterium bogoriense TaxID=246272 RepID=UPI0035712CA7
MNRLSHTYNQNWDLESFFKGGSQSEEFKQFLQQLSQTLEQKEQEVSALRHDPKEWVSVLEGLQETAKKVREAGAFVGCLNAQNIHDTQAKQLNGKVKEVSTAYITVMTSVDEKLVSMSETEWAELVKEQAIQEIQFSLEERRQRAREKLSTNEEKLTQALSIDGYHAWGDMYNHLVGKLTIPFEENGETVKLSVGQAENKMNSGQRDVRKDAFSRWEQAWSNEEELFAATLNHLAGFRLNLYNKRGWTNVLKEPLDYNRMSEKTLDAMWGTITENKHRFLPYLEKKAQLIGVEKLAWYDVHAPISKAESLVSFEEAAETIIAQFGQFSPKMAEFTKMTFDKSWIEAENRAGKRPGAFCTSFPASEETRVFMTYDGTPSNVATLAHELGHAYHQHVMNDLPQFKQNYAMNVAETASTFAEMIIADAAVNEAKSSEEKLALLDNKIGRGVAFFMNIHSRFLFETRFYEKRKEGLLTADQLNELMVSAQQEAYCEALSEYHPHFWAAKLHFHITGVPFYNFPYTFGYLFSLGVYAQALKKGTAFEDDYIALLRDTGSMTVEELATKHLQVDLTSPQFWQEAIDIVCRDVDEFMSIVK